ncbi:THAP domain-containing protein 9 [Elysia marginata]|uniref:THAP domain-containing protein 9 n=1 Tax=Elysia marginata TaxID=1093978 RepID=A0AAV4J8M5_9GAST|nr:THAP domain-containing protein 9 [Elysia marginata]
MGGCNNNPTVKQFKSAFKRLLVHNDIQHVEEGNCLPLESVRVLTVSSSGTKLHDEVPSVQVINASDDRSRLRDVDDSQFEDEEFLYTPCHTHLSMCSEKIVVYIAGFVAFRLKKTLKCEICICALFADVISKAHLLIILYSRGGLTVPSKGVIDICLVGEKYFRRNVLSNTETSETLSNVKCHKIVISVLKSFLNKPVFDSIKEHMADHATVNNHLVLLIKAVAEKYLQVRYHYAGKHYTANLQRKIKSTTGSRQVMNKRFIEAS